MAGVAFDNAGFRNPLFGVVVCVDIFGVMLEPAGPGGSEVLRTTAQRLADAQWAVATTQERIRRGSNARRRQTRPLLNPQDRDYMDLLMWIESDRG